MGKQTYSFDYVTKNIGSKISGNQGLDFLNQVVAMWRYLQDGPTAAHAATIIFALGYFICPVDAVPDITPVLGFLDDAAVIAGAVTTLGTTLHKYLR